MACGRYGWWSYRDCQELRYVWVCYKAGTRCGGGVSVGDAPIVCFFWCRHTAARPPTLEPAHPPKHPVNTHRGASTHHAKPFSVHGFPTNSPWGFPGFFGRQRVLDQQTPKMGQSRAFKEKGAENTTAKPHPHPQQSLKAFGTMLFM